MMFSIAYKQFIQSHDIEVMAEVGVYRGHTLKKLIQSEACKGIKEYWAIDPWNVFHKEKEMKRIIQEEWDEMYRKVCSLMPWWPPLKVIRMSSQNASELFPLRDFAEYFDFVMIDADHSYEAVMNDILYWRPLVKKGKYIGGHDYAHGEERGHQVKKAVLEFFKEEELKIYPGHMWIKQL